MPSISNSTRPGFTTATQNLPLAVKYCDLGGAEACYKAASTISNSQAETPETSKMIVKFGRLACHRGSLAGCNVMGHLARDYFQGCNSGIKVAVSCAFAGYLALEGLQLPPLAGAPVPKNPELAITLLKRSCLAGAKVICHDLLAIESEAGEAKK